MDYFITNKYYETTSILDDIYIWNWVRILGIESDNCILVKIAIETIFANIDSYIVIISEPVCCTIDWVC